MSSSGSESFKQVDTVLTEDDIPGASLPPPFSKYTVAEYLYRKLHSAGIDLSLMPLPTIPINGWESVSYANVLEMSTKVPQVTSGV